MPTSRQPNFSRRSMIGPLPRIRVTTIATRAASTVGTARLISSAGAGSGTPGSDRLGLASTNGTTTRNDVIRNTASASRNAPNPHLWAGAASSDRGSGGMGCQLVPDQAGAGHVSTGCPACGDQPARGDQPGGGAAARPGGGC
jgi:hypothetical protein